ncbi:MAG: Crp/Fnr family transcriptional regulator [Elusimicrobiota bacterium]
MKSLFRKVNIFSNFSDSEFKKISKILKIKKVKKGKIVFNKNEIGNSFFIVKSGKIKIFTNASHKKKVYSILGEGEFFGELALLGIKYRTASAQAEEDSELFSISSKDFQKYILKNKNFILKLLYNLAYRLKKADEEIEGLIFKNIFGRVAKEIFELSKKEKMGKIYITQKKLAENLGTTRIPVNRVLQKMKEKGIIDTSRERITIIDVDKIRSISGVKE